MKLHVKRTSDCGGRGITYGNVANYRPATAAAPFWTIWFEGNQQCIFLAHHAVDSIVVDVVGEEGGDELSANSTNNVVQSAQQT